jgi:hypothetical protein
MEVPVCVWQGGKFKFIVKSACVGNKKAPLFCLKLPCASSLLVNKKIINI